jgi:hypothetical protein
MAWLNFNGDGGGELTIADGDQINGIDGKGNWIIWAQTTGRSLAINVKNGPGSLTLHEFGMIALNDIKEGDGELSIETDCTNVDINKINGKGHVHLRNSGTSSVHWKDGEGNIYFKNKPPVVGSLNGPGKVLREP